MSFSAATLRASLNSLTPPAATGYVVGLSGGADSAALLAAAMSAEALPSQLPLRVVHIDHALQPAAAEFRRACEALCARLGVSLITLTVSVEPAAGESLEAVARDARYAALAGQLRPGECLLTAHHADDQAETLLLQLLRGAGVKGLSAMAACRPWACGWHVRPLLNVTRNDLRAFGAGLRVEAAPDPMNREDRFDRVYLRERVWPHIAARWPGAATTLSRAAGHVAEAQSLLDERAAVALDASRDGVALSITALRAMTPPDQRNVLRHWLATNAVELPSTTRLQEALRQMLEARGDHSPAVLWGGHALRRYRDRLFLTAAVPLALDATREWHRATPALHLGAGLGSLQWVPQEGGLDGRRMPETLVVRRRRGGETLRPQTGARTQSVRHLCQAQGVLPWMRDALPLVYAGAELIAVGDLWHDSRWCVARGTTGLRCVWRGAPDLI